VRSVEACMSVWKVCVSSRERVRPCMHAQLGKIVKNALTKIGRKKNDCFDDPKNRCLMDQFEKSEEKKNDYLHSKNRKKKK